MLEEETARKGGSGSFHAALARGYLQDDNRENPFHDGPRVLIASWEPMAPVRIRVSHQPRLQRANFKETEVRNA